MPKKSGGRRTSSGSGGKKAGPKYEPPKLVKFEKLERLIVSGE